MALTALQIGEMTEYIRIEHSNWPTLTVTSITRSGSTATVTTRVAHEYVTGDYVTIAGANQSDYNGRKKITVTGSTTFTFAVANSPTTPATGAITSVFNKDTQAGIRTIWRPLANVWAELIPLRADEQLQAQSIGSQFDTRFRIYTRHDVTAKMRVAWTPRWPKGATERYLEIRGIVPYQAGDQFQMLVCGEL